MENVLEVLNGPSSGGTTALVIQSNVFFLVALRRALFLYRKMCTRPHSDTM